MYTAVYAKVQLNGDTHREVMVGIGVKQGCIGGLLSAFYKLRTA